MIDLPGPRIQEDGSHTYDNNIISAITEQDKEFIKFGAEYEVDYIAVSFVGGPRILKNAVKLSLNTPLPKKLLLK